ncbi:acyl carrier protein [Streptomyces candidus]|nr:acyl carrier protein [Streptomyces candidus]
MYENIRSALIDTFRVPEDELSPQATLQELEMDSLALAEFALVLEERLGVKLETEHANANTTLAEVADHIEALMAAPKVAS